MGRAQLPPHGIRSHHATRCGLLGREEPGQAGYSSERNGSDMIKKALLVSTLVVVLAVRGRRPICRCPRSRASASGAARLAAGQHQRVWRCECGGGHRAGRVQRIPVRRHGQRFSWRAHLPVARRYDVDTGHRPWLRRAARHPGTSHSRPGCLWWRTLRRNRARRQRGPDMAFS